MTARNVFIMTIAIAIVVAITMIGINYFYNPYSGPAYHAVNRAYNEQIRDLRQCIKDQSKHDLDRITPNEITTNVIQTIQAIQMLELERDMNLRAIQSLLNEKDSNDE